MLANEFSEFLLKRFESVKSLPGGDFGRRHDGVFGHLQG